MTAPVTVAVGCIVTLAIGAGALLAAPPAGVPHPPASGAVPVIDPRMVAIDRRTRRVLDRCHARGGAPGVLVVVSSGAADGPRMAIRPAARGVCAYRVGP